MSKAKQKIRVKKLTKKLSAATQEEDANHPLQQPEGDPIESCRSYTNSIYSPATTLADKRETERVFICVATKNEHQRARGSDEKIRQRYAYEYE